MGNPGLGLEWSEDGRGVIAIPPVSKKLLRLNETFFPNLTSLKPGVNNSTLLSASYRVVPLPRLRVQRFTNYIEIALFKAK